MIGKILLWTLVVLMPGAAISGCTPDVSRPTIGNAFRLNDPHGYVLDDRGKGASFDDGFQTIVLRTGRSVVLTGVEPVGGGEALTFGGAYLLGPDREIKLQQIVEPGTADEHIQLPVRINADDSRKDRQEFELVLQYEFKSVQTISARSGIRIEYSERGSNYIQFLPSRLVICPHKMPADDTCSKWTDRMFPTG